jgi:hypothetical protein
MTERKTLSVEELQALVPSAFTETAAPTVSQKYQHIPTAQIVEDLKQLGFQPVQANEIKAKTGKGFQKHLIRFQNPELVTPDGIVELLLTNSHDARNAFQIRIGIYRFICSNGLVVPATEFENIRMRHTGYSFEDLRTMINDIISKIPDLVKRIATMQQTELTEQQQQELARAAANVRWKNLKAEDSVDSLLTVNRTEDSGNDLWSVFNRIQENMLRGGVEVKKRKVKSINSITTELRLNEQLFQLTSNYIPAQESMLS